MAEGTTHADHRDGPALVGREQVEALPADRLVAEVVALARRLSVGTYELLVLVGEVDVRGTWSASGALSCAAWLASVCDVELATARTQVRVARALRAHPALDAAVAAWSLRHDDPDEIARRQHEERSMSWRTDPDGMVTITARLPPAAAGAVCAVVDRLVVTSRAPAGASQAQQRADALVGMVTTGGAVTAEVVVHARPDGNTLADGTPLSDHAVTRLLPDAFVSLLVHDTRGRPIDASPRRRSPTRRQRRVLDEAQPHCRHPGCHATAFLQYDHIRPYRDGGPTTIDNLRRLCGTHNRAREPAP